MAAFLRITGLAAARLFQEEAAQLVVEAIASHPRRTGRPPAIEVDQATRILFKARLTRDEMTANGYPSMQIFLPTDQVAAVKRAVERIQLDPEKVRALAPLRVRRAFKLTGLP